ncbi:kish-like protein [Drosera capensis]
MSALFNFHSFLTVVLLGICTCAYVKMQFPAILEQRTGGFVWFVALLRSLAVVEATGQAMLPYGWSTLL